ncbi:hypothetical protein ABIC28_003381 [Rhodococcus sp. PvR044]|uniref:hypothetical protein n=1 Tax=Rhodococcus sp. PvR044 TaxID=3156402 RepID=UPI00339A8C91
MRRPILLGVLVVPLLVTGCGDERAEHPRPATYEEAINELVCFNPGTTFEEMDRNAREFAQEQGLSVEEVAQNGVMEARENVSVDGEFGKPCRND